MEADDQQVYVANGSSVSSVSKNIPKFLRHSAKTYFLIFGVLALSGVLSTGAYFLASSGKNTSRIANSQNAVIRFPSPSFSKNASIDYSATYPTDTPTPLPEDLSPTLSPDATASWSAYTTTRNGYSIKYPPDWTVKNETSQDPKILEYLVFNPKSATQSARSITLAYGTRTYQEALAIGAATGQIVTVGVVSGTKKIEQDSNKVTTIHVVVPFGDNSIVFYAKQQYSHIFDLMLSTFTFLGT